MERSYQKNEHLVYSYGAVYCLILDCISYCFHSHQIYDEEFAQMLHYLIDNRPNRVIDKIKRKEL